MKVAYLGNFGAPHSTENHVARAFKAKGHEVFLFQEESWAKWDELIEHSADFDFLLWTRTAGLAAQIPKLKQANLLFNARANRVPVIGYHLDRWWGLPREVDVLDDPFFRVDLLITADGGHNKWWRAARVNHLWLSPAVSDYETRLVGRKRPEYKKPVAFVGSWREYHPEWPYRRELVEWLRKTYKDNLLLVEGGVRGQDLVDLYTSVGVVVGDSCLAGGARRYWSDRIPETLGRGGVLVHPDVEGLSEHYTTKHLTTYTLGDFTDLSNKIEHLIGAPGEHAAKSIAGKAHVQKRHTYEVRVDQIIEAVGQVNEQLGYV